MIYKYTQDLLEPIQLDIWSPTAIMQEKRDRSVFVACVLCAGGSEWMQQILVQDFFLPLD